MFRLKGKKTRRKREKLQIQHSGKELSGGEQNINKPDPALQSRKMVL